MVNRSTNYEILFLFTDHLRFYPFVQNHCYTSIKLKAILYKYNIQNFQFIDLCLSIFIGNRVTKDLLIIDSKI